jgi:SAM-dependent methyltransferase
VEPSAAPVATAKPEIGPLIRQGVFRPGDWPSEGLSLVTCFQTIEHLPDPLATCRQFHRLLRPGGAVLLVGHDRRAASARLLGRRSPIFDVEHLQLFSRTSVRKLLCAAGFTRVEVRRVVDRYPLHYWVKLSPLPRALKQPLLVRLARSRAGRLPVALAAGNLAAAGFRAG